MSTGSGHNNESKKRKIRRRNSVTRSFGSSSRENHDSSIFYSSRLYSSVGVSSKKIVYVENEVPKSVLNEILIKSSESMEELPDNSIHLMVTSPPYNVGKDYDQDLSLEEYLEFLERVFREVYRVLVPGGRACINIANVGRKPYIPLNGLIGQLMLKNGFLMRGEIIWDKSASVGSSTAWGSWMSASNPTLRDIHEYILVFSKKSFKRENPFGRRSTISRDEFLEFTKSIWSFPTVSARRIGHPAPFPVELPYRLIQLYSFEGEVVLDPFMGSGQTALAALKTNRKFVGYEVVPGYAFLARERIAAYLSGGSDVK